MGTSTIFRRWNDLRTNLSTLSKKELRQIDNLSPWGKNDKNFKSWEILMELHNGNIYPLIFWKGRLMKLEEAPKELSRKYWDKYTGKTRKEYEWTLLKRFLLNQIEYLDKEFKKQTRRSKRAKKPILASKT
jgi:hypothetical protein